MRLRFMTLGLYLAVGLASLLSAVFLATWILSPSHAQGEDVQAPRPALPPPAQVQPAVPASPVTESPAISPEMDSVTFLEPYVFDLREGRRNPFQIPVQTDGSAVDLVVPGSPLERYELDELKLIGILWDVKSPKAMFADPVGEVHVLGKDDRIGRKRGYVAVIREGEVVVVETSNFNGENAFSTRVMRMDR